MPRVLHIVIHFFQITNEGEARGSLDFFCKRRALCSFYAIQRKTATTGAAATAVSFSIYRNSHLDIHQQYTAPGMPQFAERRTADRKA